MARGAPTTSERPIRFKQKFRPRKVEINIDGEDAVYVFQTAPVTRSIEIELNNAFKDIEEDETGDGDDKLFEVVGALIDKLVVPTEGKKKLASDVLRSYWEADKIEFADISDFLEDVSSQRRPS